MLTVYGIETAIVVGFPTQDYSSCNSAYRLRYWNVVMGVLGKLSDTLQQCLPFTVLKLPEKLSLVRNSMLLQQCLPFTVLKLLRLLSTQSFDYHRVATVLTVYGIETLHSFSNSFWELEKLQQCLPFTVLKQFSHACKK